jgi:hypothetical protein
LLSEEMVSRVSRGTDWLLDELEERGYSSMSARHSLLVAYFMGRSTILEEVTPWV